MRQVTLRLQVADESARKGTTFSACLAIRIRTTLEDLDGNDDGMPALHPRHPERRRRPRKGIGHRLNISKILPLPPISVIIRTAAGSSVRSGVPPVIARFFLRLFVLRDCVRELLVRGRMARHVPSERMSRPTRRHHASAEQLLANGRILQLR
ncbi:hypothetical protein PUN28_018542 [Cardiocondyla obscurior]|uniref:Uncharacterized protein n=1 Tax=Cardiocondyla obscurior TaxID=286306 RepID=A0AAW2EGK4_9HYME